MIDIENQVIDYVIEGLKNFMPRVAVSGEYNLNPSKFPCVSIEEMSNVPLRNTMTQQAEENHAVVLYEVNIYTNKTSGKKQEAKRIAKTVDDLMKDMGFERVMLNPFRNYFDTSIYRIVGRYRAVVDQNRGIYRFR